MKALTSILFISVFLLPIVVSSQEIFVDTTDIPLFWNAYDKIVSEEIEEKQLKILKNEYLERGSKGLKALIDKRAYTAEEYLERINNSPRFWNSIRDNTHKASEYGEEINQGILKLKSLYPKLRPANVYFTIGALGTGGTAHKGHVLIGSEIAMGDSLVDLSDLEPAWLSENLSRYFSQNPIDDIVLLNIHEYVHTQQSDYGRNLLAMCVFEGVAEFVSVLAMDQESPTPAIAFGKSHNDAIRERFTKEMFSPHWNDWLYNDFENDFGVRDLGYYVGYAICEKYLLNAASKTEAIQEMIELDCSSHKELSAFVERSRYFDKSLDFYEEEYISNKPFVKGLSGVMNGSDSVDPSISEISVIFSKEMNPRFRNFKLGSKGKRTLLPIKEVGWSIDKKSLIIHATLEAKKRYQLVIDDEFRDLEGRTIDKFIIDFKTRDE